MLWNSYNGLVHPSVVDMDRPPRSLEPSHEMVKNLKLWIDFRLDTTECVN